MKLGVIIKNRRRQLKLQQRVVANLADLSPEYIGKIERGETTNVGCDTLSKIADALQTDLLDLIRDAKEAA